MRECDWQRPHYRYKRRPTYRGVGGGRSIDTNHCGKRPQRRTVLISTTLAAPNYVHPVPALPLVHSAWLTAIVFSIANALVLNVRICAEDAALGYA
jgi:hypothetical protein